MKRRSFLQAGAGAPAIQLVKTQGAPTKEKFTPVPLARHYNASARDFGPRPWARNINPPEVKDDLIRRGHQFRSRSDVEVLVHAYEEWGEAFLQRIRGMFALAIWDSRTQTLIAARDATAKILEKTMQLIKNSDHPLLPVSLENWRKEVKKNFLFFMGF